MNISKNTVAILTYTLKDRANGQVIKKITSNKPQAFIFEHKHDEIVMYFNHPLADTDLLFSGEVLQVREAFEEELNMADGCGCGGRCDCKGGHAHEHSHHDSENCQLCGNQPELQGQGVGSCKCG